MGALKEAFKSLFGDKKTTYYNSLIGGNTILFSSFGNDICASDIVRTAVHRVCSEVGKSLLRSVIETDDPKRVKTRKDSINEVFAGRVNPYCGLRDFLYKVAYLTIINRNAVIYWAYDEIPFKDGSGRVWRATRGFYPIDNADINIFPVDGELWAEITSNATGEVFSLPYSDIIHVRYDFGANPLLGGDACGLPDFGEMLKNLQTLHVVKQAVPKSVEASLGLKGVLSMKTVGDIDKKTVTRDEFEQHLFSSKTGIVATDYEADFTPVNISAADIPTNIFSLIRDEILAPFGVSLPIYLGKFTDDEFTAFYQTAIEPLLQTIAEAFTITLMTPAEIAYGCKIKYYDRLIQSLSLDRRVKICEMTKDDALLDRAERRELLGYEPDNQPTRVSLNYIDVGLANEYQMSELDAKKKKEA